MCAYTSSLDESDRFDYENKEGQKMMSEGDRFEDNALSNANVFVYQNC